MSPHVETDVDDDALERAAATRAAAGVIRQLAAQLETAGYAANVLRASDGITSGHARAVDLALTTLAAALSEREVSELVHALRYAATVATEAQADERCEFCGAAIEPWSILVDESYDDDAVAIFVRYFWDQYGCTLCKGCHRAVHRTRWQAALPM